MAGETSWSSAHYVNNVTSPYTDNNFSSSLFDFDLARYSVEAIDTYDFTSGFSNTVTVNGTAMWKSNREEEFTSEDIDEYTLYSNYPNPFNPTTTISYSIPENTNVSLTVYNNVGEIVKEIVNAYQQKGSYRLNLDMSKYSTGIYYYTILTNNYIQTNKMIYIK